MPAIAVQKSVRDFTDQYGTLRAATLAYLDGRMPEPQAVAFEGIVRPEFMTAVAQVRLCEAISWLVGALRPEDEA